MRRVGASNKGTTTSSKKLLVAKGITTRSTKYGWTVTLEEELEDRVCNQGGASRLEAIANC